MHKRIKHIIASTLVLGALTSVLPANNFILGSREAFASTYTYRGASNGELSSLTISRSTGSELELLGSYAGEEVALTSKKDYYIELAGADGVEISADVKGSGYIVKQFASASKTAKGEDVGEYIDISSSYDNIYLRTYKSEEEYKDAYDNDDVTDCEKTYVIHVKKPNADSEEEQDTDKAYLSNIYLSNGDIDFSKKQMSYDANVNEDVDEIVIRATPEDDDDLVEINDSSVDKDDDYEKTITLDKGDNTITIYVENDEDSETYTLNIYRGKSTSTTQTSTSATSGKQDFAVQTEGKQYNAWQRVNGKWKYIDGTGEALKNKWWFDRDNGKSYHLDNDGYGTTGWLFDNSHWYYFNETGEMQTGWVLNDKNWYYLNKSGVMQTGWVQDVSGSWYYLNNTGAMATGWIQDSNGKSYYLDSTGKMVDTNGASVE